VSTQVHERVVYAEARGEPDLRPHTHLRVAAVAVLLLAWEAVSRAGIFPRVFLPPPSAVVVELWRMAASGDLWRNVQPSLARILGGFAIGSAAGIAFGTLAAVSVRAEAVIDPLVALAYPIPKIALLPLIILWLGIGEASKVAVIAVGAFFPVFISTVTGLRGANPSLMRAAQSLGASRWQIIQKVMIPSALPVVFAGLRLATGMSLLLVVSAEMIAATRGIGYLILYAGDLLQTTRLMAGIAVLSVLGLLSTWLLRWVERMVVRGVE
jgi:NitT/TauT family transport system permease protein